MKNSKSKKSKKFISGVILIILGVCGFLGESPVIIGGIVFIAIGVLLIIMDKKKTKKTASANGKQSDIEMKQTPDSVSDVKAENKPSQREIARQGAKTFTFNVAGVTFKNEDGTSRQSLLKKIVNGKEPFEFPPSYTLDSYEFKGEDAVYVKADDYVIGNVPRDDVSFVLSLAGKITDMEVFVYDFENDEDKTIYACEVTVFYKD